MSYDPTTQFSCFPALRKQLVVATSGYFSERFVALAVISWMCSDEVLEVLVNDTTMASCGIWVSVNLRFANPE